ncbi:MULTISPECIES: phospho-N-acetylmuramoyl-pentapeptide-transferase [Anaerotruncus]|jgi:phospho-N-acetylmuramoyl-pentapeptide-transferase|uniref:phospho-N-acetylmuramoyl-pentapeptide- transferase n=1 Tax=Anaerotruncus TaxID=244127 RepID=UPI0008379B5F|nr:MULTISPECIES: phospho-N-acetylmuramoyl-pentapeptide-transferase [Anaerotruncus]RGX54789.1 phospho-N-acetylmuramoyl-pentapeptide-transferase [Anaerotruncus sp. AF02-27]
MQNTTVLILTTLVAFFVSAALGIVLIPFLRRLKYGQTILDIGPAWHKKKQGTPTMGGIMFVIGVTIAVVVGYATLLLSDQAMRIDSMGTIKLFAGMVMALAFGAVGFLDDYIKVVKKRNLGLTARQKYLMQLIIGVFYLSMLYLAGERSTVVVIPFIGQLDLGLLYYPLAMIVITGFVNAVNLTDGIDGLASSVTFVYALVMLVISGVLSYAQAGLMSAALAGGTLGFLVWNFYPAKVFMGDTGSLFLGGLVVALAFDVGLPLLLILTGVVYWCEAFSVMLQVTYFKLTHGKRIFKMSPIHHHFEMSGWSEIKIVSAFSLVALAGGILAIFSVMLL